MPRTTQQTEDRQSSMYKMINVHY